MSGPTLDYASPERRSRWALPWPVWIAMPTVAALSFYLLVLPALHTHVRRGDYSPRFKCSSNLKQIGQAMLLYADENQGAMAPDFATLLEREDLVPEVFVCYSTNDARSPATQPAARRADLRPGSGYCSYVLVDGYPNFDHLPADAVVAFEPLANHGEQANVLFADGHVDYVAAPTVRAIEQQYRDGTRPVRATRAR